MAMPALEMRRWTADDLRALPEEPGKRFECVDGELLVSPGPRLPHQSAVFLVSRALDAYCRSQGIGAVFTAPGELELDPYTLVQPDLFVLPLVHGRRATSQEEAGHPLLFVEVVSPGSARSDRGVKRAAISGLVSSTGLPMSMRAVSNAGCRVLTERRSSRADSPGIPRVQWRRC